MWNCLQPHEPPRHEFSFCFWVSMLSTAWAPDSREMMKGLNFTLPSNICLLVWREPKLFVILPGLEPLLHLVHFAALQRPLSHFLASVKGFDLSETFCPPSLDSWSKIRKGIRKRHLAKRIFYLFERERLELGSVCIRTFPLVSSLKLMVLSGAFFLNFFKAFF